MKKRMLSLALVIPLVALISSPAVAHNAMCCVPSGPAPPPNPPAPPCDFIITAPVDAFCRMSDPANFCDASLLVTTLGRYVELDYTNMIGKCVLTGSKTVPGQIRPRVLQCPTNVTLCP